jgi:PAS domain S-box-containing protein
MTTLSGRRPVLRLAGASLVAAPLTLAALSGWDAEAFGVAMLGTGPTGGHWLLLSLAGLTVAVVAGLAGWRYRSLAALGRRMCAEQARQVRLNAVLAALSDCNQAMMRAADEAGLLAEVCRVVGMHLRVCAAQVATDSPDRPVAAWPDDREQPDGIALSLALEAEGKQLGELTLYQEAGRVFDADETILLKRLANDIAFGVLALRHREERSRATALLRESEERFRSLVDNMTDFVWEVDAEGRYTYASPRVHDILGYAPDDLIGRTPFDLMPPEEAHRMEEVFRDLAHLRAPIRSLENVNIAKDGRLVVLETSGMPILATDGTLRGYRGVDRDVTERRQAAAELQWEAEVRGVFAELGRLLLAPISIDQLSRTIVERGGRLIGTLRGCACYHEPSDGGRMVCATSDGTNEGMCGDIEPGRSLMVNTLPEGMCSGSATQLPLQRLISVPVSIDERVVGRLTFADCDRPFEPRDIEVAERLAVIYGLALRRAWDQRALEDSRTKLQTVTAAAQDGIVMLDQAGRVEFWNDGATRIFGWSESEMVGRGLCETVTLPPGQDLFAAQAVEAEGRRKDGAAVPIEITVVGTRLGDRQAAVATVKDLTERKEAERLRLEMEMRLFQAQKMDALGTLAGGIAHNFNNMLMPVMALTELTLNELPLNAPGRKRLEAVLQASQRARDLVRRILTFGRQDAPAMAPLPLAEVVAEGLELLRSALPRTVEIRERIEPVSILGDRGQLLTVLMNLGSNAADAMEGQPGVLEVVLLADGRSTRPGRPPPATPEPPFARLSVRDTGHGMDERTLRRVFEPFFTTKNVGRGTGLGLATAQAIVAAHGGDIRVRSAPGHGTTFDIYFPLLREPPQASVSQQKVE